MAKLDVIEIPSPRLRVKSLPVEVVDDALRAFMGDMLDTMYAYDGIGLAAIQVDVPKRVLVMDLAATDQEPEPRFFINPEVTWTSDEMNTYNEGCLSVPAQYAEVERPARCRVTYLDYDGKAHDEEIDGIFATCFQHEMDHLEGVLFVDHLTKMKRDMLIKKLKKARKDA